MNRFRLRHFLGNQLCRSLRSSTIYTSCYTPNIMENEACKSLEYETKQFAKQLDQESSLLGKAADFYTTINHQSPNNKEKLSKEQTVTLSWMDSLSKSIQREMKILISSIHGLTSSEDDKKAKKEKEEMLFVLQSLPSHKLALLTIYECLALFITSSDTVKFTQIVMSVGNALQAEIHSQKIKDSFKGVPIANITTCESYNQARLHRNSTDAWSGSFIAKTGGILINLLINSSVMSNGKTRPFRHVFKNIGGKRYGMVVIQKGVLKEIDTKEVLAHSHQSAVLPMVVPPRTWRAIKDGGYYILTPSLVKTPSTSHNRRLQSSSTLKTVLSSMDSLSSVPWSINKRILHTIEKALEKKVSDIPSIPQMTPTSKEENSKFYSFSRIYDTAQRFKEEPKIYYPHQMDFRGRCYPIPTGLHHMSSDLCRGLLLFHEGKPLGTSGLRAMKIQLANLHGVDKVSFDERVQFIDKHISDILDSACDPLHGKGWWKTASSPWQSLSVCFELAQALQMRDPSSFISYVPHHTDGSCNGLQHYAALGGDEKAGKSVNLLPTSSPADIYSTVLKKVEEHIEVVIRDPYQSELGTKNVIQSSHGPEHIAHFLNGRVTRKTVKQTVMTFVYGVTLPGAQRQIQNQLKGWQNISDELLHPISEYLTHIIFNAMDTLFVSARDIMNWLTECARIVGRENQPMAWTTPLGFPVEQPYRRPSKTIIQTSFQNLVLHSEDSEDHPISVQKQKAAFPPNFIHSLDSTHMLKTSHLCQKEGLSFAAVHDSYWSHAGSMKKLNEFLRESFIDLHSRPILSDLKEELSSQYPHLVFSEPPERGNLRLDSVAESPYFFH